MSHDFAEVLAKLKASKANHSDSIPSESASKEAEVPGETIERIANRLFCNCGGYGEIERMSLLLNAGVSVDAELKEGKTALYYACQLGDLETGLKTAKWLISQGANVNKASTDHCSPLISAILFRNHALAEELLSAGAEVNPKDFYLNQTPLELAAYKNDLEMTQLLLAHGAALSTAWDRASLIEDIRVSGNQKILSLLVAAQEKEKLSEHLLMELKSISPSQDSSPLRL